MSADYIKGDTAFIHLDETPRALTLTDEYIDTIVNQGAENIVLVTPTGRWVLAIDDILARPDLSSRWIYSIPLSFMTRC